MLREVRSQLKDQGGDDSGDKRGAPARQGIEGGTACGGGRTTGAGSRQHMWAGRARDVFERKAHGATRSSRPPAKRAVGGERSRVPAVRAGGDARTLSSAPSARRESARHGVL